MPNNKTLETFLAQCKTMPAQCKPMLVRNKSWGPVLVVFGLLVLFGCLMSIGDTKVQCGHDTMHTDEICRTYHKNSGETGVLRTYDQEHEYQDALTRAAWIIGSLMTIGGTTWMVIGRRYRPKAPQNYYAPPGSLPPVHPYYPPPVGQTPYPPPGSPPPPR